MSHFNEPRSRRLQYLWIWALSSSGVTESVRLTYAYWLQNWGPQAHKPPLITLWRGLACSG